MGTVKLYIRIAEGIRQQIEAGQFGPGDKLPPLAALAEEFDCSRATVREALSTLRGQGLVEFRHGAGTYVRTAAVEMWMEPLEAAWLLGVGQVEELLDTQIAILAGISGIAAQRRAHSDYSQLSQALFELECAAGNRDSLLNAELHFFEVLARVAENSILENAFRVLQESFRSILRLLDSRSTDALRTCRALYDAVQMERMQEAREIVFRYGETVGRQVQKMRKSGNRDQ